MRRSTPAVLLLHPAWVRVFSGTRPRIRRGPAPGAPRFGRRRRAGAPPWHAHVSLAPSGPGRRQAHWCPPHNGRPSSKGSSRAVLVELVPVEHIPFGEAVRLSQPVGLLQETLQSVPSASPGKPSPTLPLKQHTVQHPPDQLCLRDPELPRSRLQGPLVLLAYVQLLSDHIYIIYITRCCRNLGTMFGTGTLNAWCELPVGNLSGRCPPFRVGLLPVPEGKGTDSSWLTWTPSSPHFTLRSMSSATPIRQEGDPAPKPPSPKARSSPSPSSPGGPASPASGTSTATPRPTCSMPSLPCLVAHSSTAWCAPVPSSSRLSSCTW